jgi:hypothetical protein
VTAGRALWTSSLAIAALAAGPAAARAAPAGAATLCAGRPALTTELLGAGAYRVVRCSATGRLRGAVTVATIATPLGPAAAAVEMLAPAHDGGLTAVWATYGDPGDPAWAAAWRRGARALAAAAPAIGGRVTLPARIARGAGDSCTNAQFGVTGLRVAGVRYRYRANLARMPQGEADRVQITRGHQSWNTTRNDCGFNDRTVISAQFLGRTHQVPHTYPDRVNVVDFGTMRGFSDVAGPCRSAATLACTIGHSSDGSTFDDIDQRYSTRFRWSPRGAPGAYDVASVAAHESGHALGLAHAASSPWLTMYPQACQGCRKWRTLARGDVLGMRSIYGG